MAGYSSAPLWKKLGYKSDAAVYVEGAPETYIRQLQLPAEMTVTWAKRAVSGVPFVHLFVDQRSQLKKKLELMRSSLDSSGVVWVSWPKKSSRVVTDITEDVVRKIALPLGFVDIKVCAVDEVWSGLKLVIRKELR
jgi:hypothetical protein